MHTRKNHNQTHYYTYNQCVVMSWLLCYCYDKDTITKAIYKIPHLIWACGFRGLASMMTKQRHAAGSAKSLHLDTQIRGRDRGGDWE